MAFGKKKKNKAPAPAEAAATTPVPAPAPASQSKAQPKKKASSMSQILHESVLETALDKFKENDQFIHMENGKPKYVGLILDTANIGGLDKKSRKDEAKGSIIECINSGRISTYISSDLMDAGLICIIPNSDTLVALDEFNLLTSAEYELGQVDENGDVELLDKKVTYSEIADFASEDGNISSILDAPKEDDEPVLPAGVVQEEPEEEVVPVEEDDSDDDTPVAIVEPDEDPLPVEEPVEPEPVPESVPEETPAAVEDDAPAGDDFDPYQAAMAADQVPEQTVPGELTNQVVVRKFYSEDLGLEVTSEPFDAQFMQNNPYIPFDENRKSGWINDQLNEMSRAANVELARMHSENQWQMRERYFKLVSMACERIRVDLDIHDPDTQYGQMYSEIQADRQDHLDSIDQRVMRRKEEIENNWRERLKEVGMEAARAAQHQYRERYGHQHDVEVYNIEPAERAAIEDEYQDALHDMYTRRRVEAASLLDLSITEVLDEISDMYLTCLTDERERYAELDKQMRDFVDAHRQDDVARSSTLAEELRQTEKADKVLAEQTAKMQALSEDFRQKREKLLGEIEDLKRSNAQHLLSLKQDNDAAAKRWGKEKEEMEKKYDDLLSRFRELDATKEKEFEARFTEMRDLNGALEDRCDHLMEVHRKSNLVSVFLLIAVAIAMAAIGFIGGEYINTQNRTALEQQRILSEYTDDSEEDKDEVPAVSEEFDTKASDEESGE